MLSMREKAMPLSKRAFADPQIWLDRNVRDPKESRFYATVLAALFPHLRISRQKNGSKWWAQEGGWGGHVYDPTGEWRNVDWDSPEVWEEIMPWSSRHAESEQIKNELSHAITHPLFRTLSEKDQERIRRKASIPEERKSIDLRQILTPDVFSGWESDMGWSINEYKPSSIEAVHLFPHFSVLFQLPWDAGHEGLVQIIWSDPAFDNFMPKPNDHVENANIIRKRPEFPSEVAAEAEAVKGLLISLGPMMERMQQQHEEHPRSMTEKLFPVQLFVGWTNWYAKNGSVHSFASISNIIQGEFFAKDAETPEEAKRLPFGIKATLHYQDSSRPQVMVMKTEADLKAIRDKIQEIGEKCMAAALAGGGSEKPKLEEKAVLFMPLSKRAKLRATPPIVSLFHHLHHDKKNEKLEHEVHHCGGDHPGATYTVRHCRHGKHAIDKQEAIGHAWADKNLKPLEVTVVFSEPCEKGWWHIESGRMKGKKKK